MSEHNALTELASFVARSPLASDDLATRRRAVNAMRQNLAPQPARRRVSDLLNTVMVLSARTRRMAQPKVHVDVDVFAPTNIRAVKLRLGAYE